MSSLDQCNLFVLALQNARSKRGTSFFKDWKYAGDPLPTFSKIREDFRAFKKVCTKDDFELARKELNAEAGRTFTKNASKPTALDARRYWFGVLATMISVDILCDLGIDPIIVIVYAFSCIFLFAQQNFFHWRFLKTFSKSESEKIASNGLSNSEEACRYAVDLIEAELHKG